MATRWILAALIGIGLAAPAAAEPAAPLLWAKTDQSGGTEGHTTETDENPDQTDFGPKRFDSGSLFAQSLAAVLIILVLGAAAIFVVKRLLPRLGISQGRRINVLETVYLGSRKSLHMVQVGDRTLLVGDTRERLGLLADLTGSIEVDDTPRPTPAKRKKPKFVIPLADPEET